MKKYIIAIIAGVLALSSCDFINDKLDKYPLDTVSPGSYFMDQTQLRSYLDYCYPSLFDQELYTAENDIYYKMTLTKLQRGGTMRPTPSSGGGWDFDIIRHINTMFNYLDNCSDETARKEYSALAKFFRAFNYFLLLRDFGDVPWIDHEMGSSDPDMYKARDSRDVVMQHIIEDLDEAIANLSATNSSLYRVNRWTALAMKSRVCLFEGTWRKYHAGTEFLSSDLKNDYKFYLDLAEKAALEFIQDGPYKIYTTGNPTVDYRVLFAAHTANTTEMILAKNFNAALSFSHYGSWSTCESNSLTINKKFIDCYLMKDGTRFTDKAGWETMEYFDEVQDRDPRLSQTIRTPGYDRFASEIVEGSTPATITYSGITRVPMLSCALSLFQGVKFDEGLYYCPDTWKATDADLPIMRAAEVYLNYAEAKAEDGTLTQSDLDLSVNVLRSRAGMPDMNMSQANSNPDNNYLGNSKYGFRNVKGDNKGVILEIRRERMVELAQEGDFRWYDLMRWREGKCLEQPYLGAYFPGLGEYDLNRDGVIDLCLYDSDEAPQTEATESYKIGSTVYLSNGKSGYLNYIEAKKITHEFNENRDYLYPIPLNEIALNTKLVQNPGWKTLEVK